MRGNSCSEHDKISKYEFVGSCMAQVLSLSIFSRRPRPHCGKVHKSRDNKSRRTWKIWERVAEQVGVNHVSPLLPNLVHLFTLFARHSSQGRMKTAQGRILRGKTADIQGDSLGEWQMWSFEMSSPRSRWMCKVESRRCEKTTWRRTLVFLSFVASTTVVFLPVRTNSLVPRFFTLVARFERGNRKEGNIVARLTRTETKRDFLCNKWEWTRVWKSGNGTRKYERAAGLLYRSFIVFNYRAMLLRNTHVCRKAGLDSKDKQGGATRLIYISQWDERRSI